MSESDQAASAGALRPSHEEQPTMNRTGVVLIVDDHALLARSLVSLFRASGYDARAVHSGAEALAFVRTSAVALILLDMLMPDMSGVEVLRALRDPADGQSQSLPVVMFSAEDDPATRDKLIQLGASGFVSKNNPGGLLRVAADHVRPTESRRA
jgi:CheY-like chemotaxis protein